MQLGMRMCYYHRRSDDIGKKFENSKKSLKS